ncbi:MAG: RNA polymerase sigma factor [Bacteroidales bacterium]|nr:RNA polymerase sigma factor [Bacteroidales bacterium]
MIDDGQILELINNKKTKEKGFRLLVSQTKENLYWQIRRMVLSHEDTDDLIQEVYIKVFRNISSFKGDSSLATWIYRIAYNETVNFLKSKARQQSKYDVSLEQSMAENLQQDRFFDSSKINFLIEKAILSLPLKQRSVFTMRYYNNMPFKEMEQVMNTTESALKTSYHIAEKKIKEFLLKEELNF